MTGCCSTILVGRWLMPLRLPSALTEQFGVGVVTPGKEFSIVDGETRAFNSPPRCWSVFLSAEEYVRELLNMAQWLEQFKNRMLGYCLFCVGKVHPGKRMIMPVRCWKPWPMRQHGRRCRPRRSLSNHLWRVT